MWGRGAGTIDYSTISPTRAQKLRAPRGVGDVCGICPILSWPDRIKGSPPGRRGDFQTTAAVPGPPASSPGQQANREAHPVYFDHSYRPAEYWGNSPAPSEFEDFDVITVQSEEGIDDLKKAGYRGRIENIPLLPPESPRRWIIPPAMATGRFAWDFWGVWRRKKTWVIFWKYTGSSPKSRNGATGTNSIFRRWPGTGRVGAKVRGHGAAQRGVSWGTPRSEVAQAIDTCDIFLNTSLTEGQCLVALEVLSRGRPLIATPVGALPEVLRQRELGRLAPLGDPGAFAAAVIEVADAIRAGRMTPQSVAVAFKGSI